MTALQAPDFMFANHGSICLLRPVTEFGESWAEENLPGDAQWFGGAVAVEPRYVQPILDGIESDGLIVAGVN